MTWPGLSSPTLVHDEWDGLPELPKSVLQLFTLARARGASRFGSDCSERCDCVHDGDKAQYTAGRGARSCAGASGASIARGTSVESSTSSMPPATGGTVAQLCICVCAVVVLCVVAVQRTLGDDSVSCVRTEDAVVDGDSHNGQLGTRLDPSVSSVSCLRAGLWRCSVGCGASTESARPADC